MTILQYVVNSLALETFSFPNWYREISEDEVWMAVLRVHIHIVLIYGQKVQVAFVVSPFINSLMKKYYPKQKHPNHTLLIYLIIQLESVCNRRMLQIYHNIIIYSASAAFCVLLIIRKQTQSGVWLNRTVLSLRSV